VSALAETQNIVRNVRKSIILDTCYWMLRWCKFFWCHLLC